MITRLISRYLFTSFMILIAVPSIQSQQQIVLNFIGRNMSNGLEQKLDSIQVKDLTRSFDTTLIGVQQLVLFGTTAVENPSLRSPNSLSLSNSFGNPFSDKTSFYVTTTEAKNITLEVFNVLGMKIAHNATFVNSGTHRFLFEGGALDPGVYFLTARIGSQQCTTKMLKMDRGNKANPQLVYEGTVSGESGNSAGFTKANNMGDNYSFVGYARGFYPETIIDAPRNDTTYEFQLSSTPDHLLYIKFHDGDQFVYNRWTLDSTTASAKIGSSKRGYRIDIKKGSGYIGGYTDWFYRIGMDSSTLRKDTLYMRTETGTKADGSAFTKFVQIYGFRTKLLQSFVDALNAKYPGMGYSSIPYETWDIVAHYYDNAGNPIPIGTQWYLGDPNGTPLNFSISSFPVTVNATVQCAYDAKEEPFMVGAKQVLTWRSSVTADYSASALGMNIVEPISFSFSDDPDGEIITQQASSQFWLPLLGSFWVPGVIQELVWYQQ